MSPTPDGGLADLLQKIVDLHCQLAASNAERNEALARESAAAEILQVINSSPDDLTPAFDAILEKAHSLCGADFGGLLIYGGGRFKAVALHNAPPAFAEIARQPFPPTPNNPIQHLLEGVPLVHVADLKRVADGARDDPVPRAAVDLAGIRTLLMVPLRKDKALLGVITAYRQEVRRFSDKEIVLLQNFAAQAAIAMENARLLGELRQRTEEVAELNRGLKARVAEQVDELGRVGRLKRFLAPQLAEMIVSHGDEKILESHRREIVVAFGDLRGYTAFTETAEPEEVLDFLREYHGALGPLIAEYEGTLDQFSGDGIMVFFNDPVPIDDPAERAVRMAMAMRDAAGKLIVAWRWRGRELGFGVGIAQGYATFREHCRAARTVVEPAGAESAGGDDPADRPAALRPDRRPLPGSPALILY
jgi:adenylate cyclase